MRIGRPSDKSRFYPIRLDFRIFRGVEVKDVWRKKITKMSVACKRM